MNSIPNGFQEVEAQWLSCSLPDNIRYEGFCGSGGMGTVFRVFHLDWSISLAVKVPHKASDPQTALSFRAETEVWSDLALHPYVATLYYVRTLGGKTCTFSELVESGGMDALLNRRGHRGSDERTTLSRILTLAASTAWGLSAAHDRGIVHCDFKPGNVLLETDFTGKVTDFGLARRDQCGGFACPGGTPLYASPEQARHDRLTAATDYWSWAASCFEMFIGDPFWQSGAAVGAAFAEFLDPASPRFPMSFQGFCGHALLTRLLIAMTLSAKLQKKFAISTLNF